MTFSLGVTEAAGRVVLFEKRDFHSFVKFTEKYVHKYPFFNKVTFVHDANLF